MQTLLTRQFSEHDPPSPANQEETDRVVNEEKALLEAASQVANSYEISHQVRHSASSILDPYLPPHEKR